jgi:hypothetical protein
MNLKRPVTMDSTTDDDDDVAMYKNNKKDGVRKSNNPSNLCTKYIFRRKRFCGNYCSQKKEIFNRRCWRHKKVSVLPPIVIVMIVSDKIYNKGMWIDYLESCDKHNIPLELVIYNEYMYNGTLRNSYNFLSRFRPIAKVYMKKYHMFSLLNNHASINYANIYFDMLKYVTDIPKAKKCIIITETTIPIRSPVTLYKTSMSIEKCLLDVSYNVRFSNKIPHSLPLRERNKNFEVVNNRAQSLYTVEFLKSALPTLSLYCKYFGISDGGKEGYKVTNNKLLREWEDYTAAMLDEFWLLNSYLIHLHLKKEPYPIKYIKNYVESSSPNLDRLVVADFPEWRNDIRRSYIFYSFEGKVCLKRFDTYIDRYYKGLKNIECNGERNTIRTSLSEIIAYLRTKKKNVLFFRSVKIRE